VFGSWIGEVFADQSSLRSLFFLFSLVLKERQVRTRGARGFVIVNISGLSSVCRRGPATRPGPGAIATGDLLHGGTDMAGAGAQFAFADRTSVAAHELEDGEAITLTLKNIFFGRGGVSVPDR